VIGLHFYVNFRGTRQSAVKLTFVCYKVATVDGTSNRMVYVVPSSACKVNVCSPIKNCTKKISLCDLSF